MKVSWRELKAFFCKEEFFIIAGKMVYYKILFTIHLAFLILGNYSEASNKQHRREVQDPEGVNVCNIADPTIIYCYCDNININQVIIFVYIINIIYLMRFLSVHKING